MSKQRPVVIVTRRWPEGIEERMAELFDVRFNLADLAMSQDALAAAMQDCDVLLPTVTDRIDAELIARAAPRLKLIANFGNGVDNIDVGAAGWRHRRA